MRTVNLLLMGVGLWGGLPVDAGMLITDGVDYGSLPAVVGDVAEVAGAVPAVLLGAGGLQEAKDHMLRSVNPFVAAPIGVAGGVSGEKGVLVLGEILRFRVGWSVPARGVTLDDLVGGRVWTDIKPEAH